jgi:hypothetical protein
MGGLQPQDQSARGVNNVSVVMSRLAAMRLFEHSAITDSAISDGGQAVRNRFHCASGVLPMRYLRRYEVPAEALCIDEPDPRTSQASIMFSQPTTKLSQVQSQTPEET